MYLFLIFKLFSLLHPTYFFFSRQRFHVPLMELYCKIDLLLYRGLLQLFVSGRLLFLSPPPSLSDTN